MTNDVKNLGTILGVWAHPDDETFCAGGLIATAIKNGQKVIIVTATKGEAGVQDESRWPAEQLGQIRQNELAEALQILGVQDHIWLDYPDGGCDQQDQARAVSQLIEIIKNHQPDTVLTFGPDGLTGHSDHSAVSAWTTAALEASGNHAKLFYAVQTEDQYAKYQAVDDELNFFFNTEKPPIIDEHKADLCCRVEDELIGIKMRALRAMPSQYQIMFDKFDEPTLWGCFDREAFMLAK